MKRLGAVAFLLVLPAFSAAAQPGGERCRGPIYNGNQVSKRAKLIDEPNFSALHQSFGKDVSGRVSLEAVLCRSGRITDIRLIHSEPPRIGDLVAAALSLVRFKPAELNWHTVSQREQFEFHIGDDWKLDAISSTAAKGRVVEELDVIGYRRMTLDQIMALIQTRAGDLYDLDQVQRDLLAINASGYFDSRSTRVRLEDAVRGGVRITFEVHELPLIKDIKIEGLKTPDDAGAVIKEFDRQRVNLHKDGPLDTAQLKKATRVIEQLFQSQGWANVKADAFVENISATEVSVVFKISGRDFD